MKYPMIEKLGLRVVDFNGDVYFKEPHHMLYASDLQSLLTKAKTVYGFYGSAWTERDSKLSDDTHTALLIAVEPIKRGVTKAEVLDMLDCLAKGSVSREGAKLIKERIEQEGIINE